MRALRLARIAAEAEALRLRLSARRAAIRALLALVALGFMAGAAVFCHIAAWAWLRQFWAAPAAALIVAGADLVLALILGFFASRSSPGPAEVEALALRQRALESATTSLTTASLLAPLIRLAVSLARRRS